MAFGGPRRGANVANRSADLFEPPIGRQRLGNAGTIRSLCTAAAQHQAVEGGRRGRIGRKLSVFHGGCANSAIGCRRTPKRGVERQDQRGFPFVSSTKVPSTSDSPGGHAPPCI